ncbi:IclR family transcriptional regulator [Notoacmeibacter marinus]|uniref:IclR family transcriptional regulator n=1 Tax=Notoacmeibacter marinus TaxID=1876515 RepID=UPI0013B04C15|nr:IclR family transcriptional regulator [Notoacmeibacter marinus]
MQRRPRPAGGSVKEASSAAPVAMAQKASSKTPQAYAVPALDKALDVIELLSARAASMSQTEIARALDRGTSEIFRTLSALEQRGYIRRTEGGRFRLTLKVFELSRMHSPYDELLRVAGPIMKALAEELVETCHLTVLRDGQIVVLAQHESPKPVRLSIEVGSIHSPLATTSGRIILASMNEEKRTEFLSGHTDFDRWSPTDRKAFVERIRMIQERGYEIADGERFVGGLDIGVLVGSPDSAIRAALIVATLKTAQTSGPDPDEIARAVGKAGDDISRRLGLKG